MNRTRLRPKRLVATCLLGAWAVALYAAAAQAFVLVSPEEHAAERAKGEAPMVRGPTKGDIGSPDIILVRPSSLADIPSPLDIELRFVPKAPSKIVRDSLRVLYGFFGFNVTDRLTKHAEVTGSGILARNAELPAGSHSITIEIADDRERVGRKTFKFEIKDH